MVISWLGLSCFRISSGNLSILTDPFSKNVGLAPPRGHTDLVIASQSTHAADFDRSETFVIDGPGEFDVKGLFVHGIPANSGPTGTDIATIYGIRMEDIRLGFLGTLKAEKLTDEQLEDLGEIDILFVPVGGKTVCDAEAAVTIVNQIEPHLVIPMHYAQPGLKISLEKLDPFLKELGAAQTPPQDKLTLKKSAFMNIETTQVTVLAPQR